MSEFGPVVIRHTIPAAQDAVWRTLTDDTSRKEWWPDTEIDPVLGGVITTPSMSGAIDVLVEGLTLGFRWRAEADATDRTVVIMLRPEDDDFDATRVTVIESGFATLPNATDAVRIAEAYWQENCEALAQSVTIADDGLDEEPGEATALGDTDSDDLAGEDVDPETYGADRPEGEVDDVDIEMIDDDTEAELSDEDADEGDSREEEHPSETVEVIVEEHTHADEQPSFEEILHEDDDIIEIVEKEIIDAEPYDEEDAVLLPELGSAAYAETGVHITANLGVDEHVDVDETSEWERLLRGEDYEDGR